MKSNSTQTPETVNPLAEIITTANDLGRHIKITVLHKTEKGSLVFRADLRGYLFLEVWPKGSGPTSRLVFAYWDWRGEVWVQSIRVEQAEGWMVEARELLGIEPPPAPVDPVAQIVADIIAQTGHDFQGRLDRAAEMVRQGQVDFSKNNTQYHPHGATGHWSCECADMAHRSPRWAFGAGCKHGLAGFIQMALETQQRQVGYAKLSDRIELRRRQREQALPASVCNPGRMEDYLG